MTHDQEQLIIELLEDDIRQHAVKSENPMVQAWADGRAEHAKETLESLRKLLSENTEHRQP